MIPTTPEFDDIISGPHTNKVRLDVESAGVIVDKLFPHEGSINVDSQSSIRRRMSVKISDPERKYTPQGAADLFNPTAGTILRPYVGAEIPMVERTSVIVDSADDWNSGTLTDILVVDNAITIA